MATIYTLNDVGRVFDFTLPSSITPGDVQSQKIVFYRPDGTRFEKDAILVSDVVTYDNSAPDESILDLKGDWEYTAKVFVNIPPPDSDILEVPEHLLFWVE